MYVCISTWFFLRWIGVGLEASGGQQTLAGKLIVFALGCYFSSSMLQFLSSITVYEQCPQIMTTYSFFEDPWRYSILGSALFVNLSVYAEGGKRDFAGRAIESGAGVILCKALVTLCVVMVGLMTKLDEIINFSFSAILGFSINLTLRFPDFDLSQGINVLHVLFFLLTMLDMVDLFAKFVKCCFS